MSLSQHGQELLESFQALLEAEKNERVKAEQAEDEEWLEETIDRAKGHFSAGPLSESLFFMPINDGRSPSSRELGRIKMFAEALGLPDADKLQPGGKIVSVSSYDDRSFHLSIEPRALGELLREVAK